MPTEKDTVRINTRVHRSLNEWIENYCENTGMSKATLIYMALEQYRQQQEAITNFQGMGEVLSRLERMESKISK